MQYSIYGTTVIQVANQYISRALYVASFKEIEEKIRLRQAEAEHAFGSMFNVQSRQTNVPDELDHDFPRIVFSANHKTLAITQARCQLEFAFERDSFTLDQQLAIIRKNVGEFYHCLLAFKPEADFGGMALILEENFPTSIGKPAMQQHLYDRFFVKRSGPGSLASVTFQIGFESKGYFLNFGANVYEIRATKFDPPVLARTMINIRDVPMVEEGIGLKIDVNDLPRAKSEGYKFEPPEVLISTTFEFARTTVQEVFGIAE